MGCCQNVPLEGDISSLLDGKPEKRSIPFTEQLVQQDEPKKSLYDGKQDDNVFPSDYLLEKHQTVSPKNSPKGFFSAAQQVVPKNTESLIKPVNFFGGIVKNAVVQVKQQGEALEIDKHLLKGVDVAGQFANEGVDAVGGAIKEGYEQSAQIIQAQVSILKEGLDDAIKAVKDLKIQKRLNDIVYPIFRKVFIHSVSCEIESKYTIKEILGKGSCSTVKKVVEISTGYERAAKIMVKNSLTESQTNNIISEIETLKVLDHQNIVRVYEIIEEVSKLCIITELCSGGELFDRVVATEGFDELKASEIMFQLLSGVVHIHKNGFIHRDLKPENLLFEDPESNIIKIIDFGIAKEGELIMKKKNSCVGSAYYMSPEAINGNYDYKSDIWSCGVILYILLCGSPPFSGKSEKEIFSKISRGVFRFSDRKWKKISKEAKDLVQKMLSKDISHRPTAEEAFSHPWIQNYLSNNLRLSLISSKVLSNLQQFRATTRLQLATLSFIASNILSGQEIKELREAFVILDTDGDGHLTQIELQRGFSTVSLSSAADLEDILKYCDMDMNGMIDYNEFLTAAMDWQKNLSEEMLENAFKAYDVDQSGGISIREIKQFLGVSDEDPDDIWSQVLQEADENGDGEIDMEEFKQLMRSKFS